jgi:hypothetical protein
MLQGANYLKMLRFACFGVFQIIDDLKSHSEEEVIQLVQKLDGKAIVAKDSVMTR